MAMLTPSEIEELQKSYDNRKSYGAWESYEETVHLVKWTHPTEPIFRDPDNDGLSLSDIGAEYTCVAALGYESDMTFIAMANNAFPKLLAMARELINAKRLLVESFIFDAFTYADPHHWTGEQTLHTAMQHYRDAGLKEEHWVEHVYNVLNDTCHDLFEEADDETDPGERYISVLNAWCGNTDFPTTFQEIEDIQPK